MKIFGIADKAYVINLTRRPDRLETVNREFARIGIAVERFEAVDVRDDTGRYRYPAELGCKLSHLTLLNNAKKNGCRRVLIFEDDVRFSNNFSKVIGEVISQLSRIPKWDIFLLGGNGRNRRTPFNTPNIVMTRFFINIHAYIANVDTLLYKINLLKPNYKPIDVVFGNGSNDIRKPIIAYAARPALAIQRDDFSDIRERHSGEEYENGRENYQIDVSGQPEQFGKVVEYEVS